MLVAPRFDPEDVEFVLLDLHARSLASAATLVEGFDLGAWIGEYVEGDAATHRCPDDRRPHVLVTEAMQRALEKEPQVTIVANLAPQLLSGGCLVPEEITLQAVLVDGAREFEALRPRDDGQTPARPPRIVLGDVFELNRATRLDALDPVRVVLPEPLPEGHSLVIQTVIRIHGDVHLDDKDSGLTIPALVQDLPDVEGGETIEFRYRFDPVPGLVPRVV